MKLSGNTYFLDASIPKIGFSMLPESCYNGVAWVLDKTEPYSLNFSPDSLLEKKITTLFISNDNKNKINGSFKTMMGNIESFNFRGKTKNTIPEDLQKEFQKLLDNNITISNLNIDSLSKYEAPISISYNLSFNFNDDIVYFNPMVGEELKENPFRSAERHYPVEMPHAISKTYVLDMDIPTGYIVEELPKPAKYSFNQTEGQFEYLCTKSGNKIQLRTSIVIKKTKFRRTDYDALREFYSSIIKKQGEQIVFKRIK